jgi:pimeloyl-ACP methyl ester carboxylesterase
MLVFRQDGRTKNARVVKLASWRRQTIDTDAGMIETLDIGAGQSRAILLLTHGLGSLHSMEEIAEGLSERYPGRRIVAFSRPGRGASPLPAGDAAKDLLSHEAHRVLPALMRSLGLTSVDLVAHSDGVAVAMLFACSHPWMVGRMVAICPQVHADSQFSAMTEEGLADARFLDDIERLGAEHSNTEVATWCWSSMRQALSAKPEMVLDRVEALTAPLLLIQGLKGEYGAQGQMEALSDRVHGQMKWVMLRQDGHFPQHDNADVVIDMICGHLEESMPNNRSTHDELLGTI